MSYHLNLQRVDRVLKNFLLFPSTFIGIILSSNACWFDVLVPVPVPTSPTDVQGFACPRENLFPFGDHSRHPYPNNCHLFIMCLKDGTLKVGGCESDSLYSPVTQNCELPNKVPGCSAKSYRLISEDESWFRTHLIFNFGLPQKLKGHWSLLHK